MNTYKEHQFVLKEDGKIYLVEMPLKDNFAGTDYSRIQSRYESAVRSAMDSAVEVSNQEITAVIKKANSGITVGKVYSLLCSVEKQCCAKGFPFHCEKGSCIHERALVTFPDTPSPVEKEETHPIAMRAGDLRVMVNGEPVAVDFRIISEELYQKLTRK
jgi:hypothetical protein